MDAQQESAAHVETLRGWIFAVLVLGLAGTVIELILLRHYEQPMQLVPVALIVLSAAALGWNVACRDAASLNALMIIMALCVLASGLGVIAHFHGSAQFQLELDPSIGWWELLMKVLQAKAPPLLAPGMMMQLGLLGLAYVFSDSHYRARTTGVLRFLRRKQVRMT
jgi:hypothetical protein